MPQKSTDYLGDSTPDLGRGALVTWGQQAAAAKQDNLTGFFNYVVVMNVPTDLYGSTTGVATDDGRNPDIGVSSLSPSLMGQEMGHGYNLNHSRIEGSGDDYRDQWDIMSTIDGCYMAPHPVYTERDVRGQPIFRIGPGLNAANMWAMNWLDMTRTWTADTSRSQSTVQFRPLHRRDLPGYLCARYGQLFIEFRMNDLWDAALPQPVVLIHDYFDGHSYVYSGNSGTPGLTAGDYYSEGDISTTTSAVIHGAGLKISVTDINADTQTATIQINVWKDHRVSVGPGETFGGVTNDGGGRVFVNGHWYRIPPNSPLIAILEQVVDAQQGEVLRHGKARDLVQRQAYESIVSVATRQIGKMTAVRVPNVEVGLSSRNRSKF